MRVDVDSAVGIDFGLILTELLANALKHALVPKGGGRLLVSVREEGGALRFEVSDDGPGFSEGFEPGNNETLGYKIVQALLRRREGTIRVTREKAPSYPVAWSSYEESFMKRSPSSAASASRRSAAAMTRA